jgi:outer membrane receptor protein involved in Fe transport
VAILAADVAACTPLNPFGEGNISPEARNYVLVDSSANGKITQFVASGFVAGDTSQFFELPGGPVGFSVGAEYRRETVRYDLDDLTQQGYAFYNAIPTLDPPANEVKEVFAEVRLPVLANLPFAQELTLNASGRVSDYKGTTGTVYTYAGSVDYKPVEDVTLRGSYSRAIRAPNLAERFSEQSQNFAPAPDDPCSERNIGAGSQFRAANCQAAGRPAGYDFVYTSSLEILSGGNPELQEEKSTSYTIGGIFTPQAVPGFSLSVDYFNIKVDNVITSVTAQDILNNCYDSPTLNNPFCGSFQRAGAGGGPRGEQPFRVLEGSLLASTLNFAQLTAKGIDFEIGYRSNFDWGSMNLRTVYTRALERNDYLDPADPSFADRILGEAGDPENQVNFNADLDFGKLTFGYELRWIDNQYIDLAGSVYENYNSFQGRAPQNEDFSEIIQYSDVFYHDIRLGYDFTDRLNAYFGVDNLFNRKPPLNATGVTGFSSIYDARGQFFYAGFTAKF